MDEKFVKQYDYKANSNLVLPTNTGLIDKRPSNEATGEVQSLVGRIGGKMGDRVLSKTSKPPKQEEDEKHQRDLKDKKRRRRDEPSKLKQELAIAKSFSIADIDTKDLLYQPKSELTASYYGLIIKFVRKYLGFQHNSVINGAADEVIGTMKDPSLDEAARRSEIGNLLSSDEFIDDDDYNELSNLCKKINDWDSNKSKVKDDIGEEEVGEVGVIVSDDDVASDEYLSEVRDSDDDYDLDEMFEKENKANDALNLEELAKRQTAIVPKIDIGEPTRKEGYHEYNIVPNKRPTYRVEDLIRIDDLPSEQRRAFSNIKTLNFIQSQIYKKAIGSDKSLLICAPTGAGKTNIAMLTMLREILKYPKKDGGYDVDRFKIIYVAPIKALVQEIVENFSNRLGKEPYNLKVSELTGDHQLDQRQISRSQIIICTPEKWDIVTRKSVDRLYTKQVKLVIFDEIHLLHNERGATLEALVARMKRHKSIEGEPIRIIGLSATLPNFRDVSRFIAPGENEESSTFYFDSTHRPIPLKQQYIALTENKKAFRMINDIVYEKVIERLMENSQILIFVHSRPDTVKTAEFIRSKALEQKKDLAIFLSSESAVDKINESGKNLSPKLKEFIQFGIGTHHAGMSKTERACVEELFRGRYIKVLISTATLAWGVNLPARTVIIKGTQVYRDGRWTDLDSLDVTQMLGRAGRPGFDREGEGIVITQQSKVAFYISLMTEQLPVESKLIGRLPEFVNAECVIGNIESIDNAVNWLSETYLSSRMLSVLKQDQMQYMSMYGITPEARKNDPNLATHRQNLAYKAASMLDDRGLIVFDRVSGAISSTELGRVAASFNCSSRTIKMFYDSVKEHTSDTELFRTFSLADEFKDIFIRRGEEADLMTLMNQVPYPIDDKRATPGANKVNVLLQVYIFRLNIEGSDLICDMHFIKDNAARLARAIHEIVLLKGYASVAELSLDLCRKIERRMTVCHSPLRQFADDLDADIVNKLEKRAYHIDELRVLKADQLAELLRCPRHHGEKVHKMLKFLPKLKLEASIKPVSKNGLQVDISIIPAFSWNEKYHGHSERFWLLIEDVNQEVLLHQEIVHVRKHLSSDRIRVSCYIPYLTPVHPFYYLRIFPDRWFGCDQHLPLYIEKLTLPDDTSITTQLLDLDPQTIRSLENPLFERHYENRFKGANFNQIQTQAFNFLYNSNEDLILLAAAGSGKTVCAELAIIRNINRRGTASKCAYIAPNAQVAKIVYESWLKLFGQHYKVVLLTGNHRSDAARVDNSNVNIVIGDPENWHVLTLTRSKKYRNLMNKFQLFIIDDIHILHDDNSSLLEWVCSKIRMLTKLSVDDPARLVVLGSPMAGAESIKNWLAFERGSKEPVVLNYSPGIRPIKLELTIQKYHHYDYKMRLLTMQRPVYRYINHTHRGKPALIVVADHHQALGLSEALGKYSFSESRRFNTPRINFDNIQDSRLKDSLMAGVGFLYCGMPKDDRVVVERLFETEQINVLVATVAICWSLQCRSYLTIIMNTQHHDGVDSSDYQLTDIIHIIGLTGRPLVDHECKCIIMCHYSKADYYDRFLREPLPSESDLPVNLISHVNYEVATGSLTELNNIYKPYLAHTYFYKRITMNPNFYGVVVSEDPEQKARDFGNFFNNLVNKVALELEKNEFISMEGTHENPNFSAGLLAKISLEYHISYDTLSNYIKWLTANSSTALQLKPLELIELISSNTQEFKKIQVKNGELSELKSLQRRHRPREGDQLHKYSFKIKLLILSQYQKTDGKEDRVEGELIADRQYVISTAHRLLMAIVDIAWLKDSFALAKSSLQLSKKLCPFYSRDSRPNLDMDISIVREDDQVKIDVTIIREDEPFTSQEFDQTYLDLPAYMFRPEGWCFLVHGISKIKKDDPEKFLLFKRVKTPSKGNNEYSLDFTLTGNAENYTYDLYFMSDFYSTSEDRRVANIDISGIPQ